MELAPIQMSENGRTSGGKFGLGNRVAVGHSSHGKRLRSAVLSAITTDDVSAIIKKLVESAKAGDFKAEKLLLDFIGKPKAGDGADYRAPVVLDTTKTLEEQKQALRERIMRLAKVGVIPSM